MALPENFDFTSFLFLFPILAVRTFAFTNLPTGRFASLRITNQIKNLLNYRFVIVCSGKPWW